MIGMGFRGFVVSDWGADHDDAKSLLAGMDMKVALLSLLLYCYCISCISCIFCIPCR
jgi:hypothetical protein